MSLFNVIVEPSAGIGEPCGYRAETRTAPARSLAVGRAITAPPTADETRNSPVRISLSLTRPLFAKAASSETVTSFPPEGTGVGGGGAGVGTGGAGVGGAGVDTMGSGEGVGWSADEGFPFGFKANAIAVMTTSAATAPAGMSHFNGLTTGPAEG